MVVIIVKFGDRIAQLRNKHELTQEALAKKVGISRAALSHYEKSRREPDYETLQKLANFFDVTIDYLLCRTDDPNMNLSGEDDDLGKMLDDPDLNLFFKEMKGTPEEIRKEMLEYLRFRKQQLEKEKNND